jgi:hypothetical protein
MIPTVKGCLRYWECGSQGLVILARSRKILFNEYWTNFFFLLSLQRRYFPAFQRLLTTTGHREAEGLEEEGELSPNPQKRFRKYRRI